MLTLSLKKAVNPSSNLHYVKSAILSSVSARNKTEAASPASKPSSIESGKAVPKPSQSGDTAKDAAPKIQPGAGAAVSPSAVKQTAENAARTSSSSSSSSSSQSCPGPYESSLPTHVRVMEFEEIPCPGMIKYTSKLLSYLPALGSQLTANLARNGMLPVRHLLNHYGPVVRLSGPLGGPILLVARPDLLEAVFAEEGSAPDGIGFDSLRHYRKTRQISNSTPATSEPLSSAQTRAALAAATARVEAPLFTGLEQVADRFVVAVSSTRSPQGEVPVETALRYWAVESAAVAAFGQPLDQVLGGVESDVERAHAAFVAASEALRACENGLQLWRWFPTVAWSRLESSLDQLHRILGKRVWSEHGRYQTEEPPEKPKCVLDALMRIGLDPDSAINAIVELFLVAGNTTACAAGMLLYELARHPRDQRTVLEESRPHLRTPRSKFEKVPEMTYLHACVKEALRLHPPVPTLTRVLPRAARLHQYQVPQGTVVVLASAQVARRADQFDDAERFQPKRWLEEDPGRHPLSGLPWGGGARACPAAPIAATQLALLAAKTVRAFHIEHEYGQVHLTTDVLAGPSKQLRLRFVDRTN